MRGTAAAWGRTTTRARLPRRPALPHGQARRASQAPALPQVWDAFVKRLAPESRRAAAFENAVARRAGLRRPGLLGVPPARLVLNLLPGCRTADASTPATHLDKPCPGPAPSLPGFFGPGPDKKAVAAGRSRTAYGGEGAVAWWRGSRGCCGRRSRATNKQCSCQPPTACAVAA